MADTKSDDIRQQVSRILDETRSHEIAVIVQMESDRPDLRKLTRAAGEALSRRRLSLTARDLLPAEFEKMVRGSERQETASTHSLLGEAATEALTLAKIQKLGRKPLDPLLKSKLVKAA